MPAEKNQSPQEHTIAREGTAEENLARELINADAFIVSTQARLNEIVAELKRIVEEQQTTNPP